MLCMNIILYIENFLKIKENQDHYLKNKWKLYWFSWGRTWINSNLKNNVMVKILKDKFGIEVSESTIRRALNEHEYHYIGHNIYLKILGKSSKKDLFG